MDKKNKLRVNELRVCPKPNSASLDFAHSRIRVLCQNSDWIFFMVLKSYNSDLFFLDIFEKRISCKSRDLKL